MESDGSSGSSRDKKYIELAAKMSKFGGYDNFFIGAVVVKKNDILGVGANRGKTHPLQKHYAGILKQCLHAEVDALIQAMHKNRDISRATIYVTRVRRSDGLLSMAKPCPSCMAAIIEAGIRKIVYTDWNGAICVEKLKK